MRILLIGEYSRLHNSLKEGLEKLGHKVVLIGTKDGFKNFPVDLDISPRFFETGFLRFVKRVMYRLFRMDLLALERGFRFYRGVNAMGGFDVVQLINERAVKSSFWFEKLLIKKLKSEHGKLFLLCCGTDYTTVSYAYNQQLRYSYFTPFFEGLKFEKETYKFLLLHLNKAHKKFHNFLYKNIRGVIASDMDYHLPLQNHPKYLGLIPNPINVTLFPYKALDVSKNISIFHGINRDNYHAKGNYLFEKALEIIKTKYSDRVTIYTVHSVPYEEYIEMYNNCHILLDQVFSYDQGYNALEAMSKGKVVFTGAETEFLEHYQLPKNKVCINALPDVSSIVYELEQLILHPNRISEISINASEFVKEYHDYKTIATKYMEVWTANDCTVNTKETTS